MTSSDQQDTLPRGSLVKQYKDLTRAEVPVSMSSALLSAIVAYETQAARKGGLPVRLRNQLQSIAENAPLALAAPSLRSGARLVRDWNGASHVVDVVKGGFIYRGRKYKSLSAIAREITGARWSGPRFFGPKPSE
jgi:hypothetical protein